MNTLLAAQWTLLVGAAACLLPMRNAWRAALGLLSQAGATLLVLSVALPVVLGGPPLQGELAWQSRWACSRCGSMRWAPSSSSGRCR